MLFLSPNLNKNRGNIINGINLVKIDNPKNIPEYISFFYKDGRSLKS